MIRLALKILFLFGLVLVLGRCQKPIEYSPIPEIEFDSLAWFTGVDELENESKQVMLVINIIDGDGNIGLQEADTLGPHHPDSAFYYNMFINLYEKKQGEYQQIELAQPHFFRVPYYEPIGLNKTIKAKIEINWSYPLANIEIYDTIRYDAIFYDRDLQGSNLVVSPDIVVTRDSFYLNPETHLETPK